jgi:hypothetical protein
MHPAYDFVFLFDHSAGHAKQRPDGLNQHRMNRSFGGKAAPMHSTIILCEQGYLGTFPRILEPGDTQELVFSAADTGPFWMSSSDREESRRNQLLGSITVVKLKTPELIAKFVREWCCRYGWENARQLKGLCAQHGIPTVKTVSNSFERNRSELELQLKGRGVVTKGKNKRELVNCASTIKLQL